MCVWLLLKQVERRRGDEREIPDEGRTLVYEAQAGKRKKTLSILVQSTILRVHVHTNVNNNTRSQGAYCTRGRDWGGVSGHHVIRKRPNTTNTMLACSRLFCHCFRSLIVINAIVVLPVYHFSLVCTYTYHDVLSIRLLRRLYCTVSRRLRRLRVTGHGQTHTSCCRCSRQGNDVCCRCCCDSLKEEDEDIKDGEKRARRRGTNSPHTYTLCTVLPVRIVQYEEHNRCFIVHALTIVVIAGSRFLLSLSPLLPFSRCCYRRRCCCLTRSLSLSPPPRVNFFLSPLFSHIPMRICSPFSYLSPSTTVLSLFLCVARTRLAFLCPSFLLSPCVCLTSHGTCLHCHNSLIVTNNNNYHRHKTREASLLKCSTGLYMCSTTLVPGLARPRQKLHRGLAIILQGRGPLLLPSTAIGHGIVNSATHTVSGPDQPTIHKYWTQTRRGEETDKTLEEKRGGILNGWTFKNPGPSALLK